MENYRLTKKADSDLSSLYEYGVLHFGLTQAQDYVIGLYDRFQILGKNPLFGRNADELTPKLRRSEYQSHVIFYMNDNDGLLIVRILREEMDLKRHF